MKHEQTNRGADMQRVIWKQILTVTRHQRHLLPDDAEVLDVQAQNGEICVWLVYSPDVPWKEFGFFIFDTGQPIPDDIYNYIGTVQAHPFVWHVFLEGDE